MQKLGINEVWQLPWWKELSGLFEHTEVYQKKSVQVVKKQMKLLLIDFNLGWNTSCSATRPEMETTVNEYKMW